MKKYLQERKRLIYLVSPALIGAVYLIACFVGMNQSIWLGESYNLYLARFDFAQIAELASANGCPPLFFFVLKIWAHFCGYDIVTMRAMAAIFGAIAIVFTFLWLKYKYGSTVAIASSFLMALSPILVRGGQEMTMFTMILAIVAAATFFLQLAIDNRKKCWWIIYFALTIIGVLTHYSIILAWLAHAAYLILVYRKKIVQQKVIYFYLIPLALCLPWLFQHHNSGIAELSATNIVDIFTKAMLYGEAVEITNWLLIPFILFIALIIILAVRYRQKIQMLSCTVVIPIIVIIILSLPPLGFISDVKYLIYSMVGINIMSGVVLVLFARERLSKKRKKAKKFMVRHPEIPIVAASIIIIATPILGLSSVYQKGNYDFATGQKTSVAELFENIVALDRYENLSIIVNSASDFYNLSAYGTKQHDINFIEANVNYDVWPEALKRSYFGRITDLQKFLEKRDAIWYVGVAPAKGQFEFPDENWRVTTYANLRFDDDSPTYQILKLEKE